MAPYKGIISQDWIEEVIDSGELTLVFQPQNSLSTGTMTGMEALIRWNSKRVGLVDTGCFINALERSQLRLIKRLHEWVLRTALAQMAEWQAMGLCVTVFLNFSTRYLQCREVAQVITCLLEEYQIPAHLLGVEVTETAPITDVDNLSYVLDYLRNLGVQVALDDFCTSYCSLDYLTDLPTDMIKLDKRFVHGLVDTSEKRRRSMITIVESLVIMSHNLGIKVVAEGVETLQQLEIVDLLECDIYQGYLLSRPVAAPIATVMMSEFHGPDRQNKLVGLPEFRYAA